MYLPYKEEASKYLRNDSVGWKSRGFRRIIPSLTGKNPITEGDIVRILLIIAKVWNSYESSGNVKGGEYHAGQSDTSQ